MTNHRSAVGVAFCVVVCALLLGCGSTPQGPAATATLDVAPTQTRAAELAQLATLTAPTATPSATPTPISPTATATTMPTSTPLPPTATPEPPTPTRPTVVSAPSASVSPTSGPPGTRFVFAGRDFPPGAVVTWTISTATAASTTGNFSIAPGQTAFSFTVTSDQSSGGRYSASFTVGGRQAFVTVPFAVTSPAAAQVKAQMRDAIDRAIPGVDKVITTCPGANPLICQGAYDSGVRDYVGLKRYIVDLARGTTVPPQCGTLLQQVMQALNVGPDGFDSFTSSFSVSTYATEGEAVRRATVARQALLDARALITDRPGDCI